MINRAISSVYVGHVSVPESNTFDPVASPSYPTYSSVIEVFNVNQKFTREVVLVCHTRSASVNLRSIEA